MRNLTEGQTFRSHRQDSQLGFFFRIRIKRFYERRCRYKEMCESKSGFKVSRLFSAPY
jgi:hypothetical protein